MGEQAAELEQLARELRERAVVLREEAEELGDEIPEIEAEHRELLIEIQEPLAVLRKIAGLPERSVAAGVDELGDGSSGSGGLSTAAFNGPAESRQAL